MSAPPPPQWAADLASVMREHGIRMAVMVLEDGQVHVLGARREGGKAAADRLRRIAAQIDDSPPPPDDAEPLHEQMARLAHEIEDDTVAERLIALSAGVRRLERQGSGT